MRLKSLRLENFKCFKEAEIDFGRVTLLTGANSSGKSSLIYGLLGALQSDNFPFQFSTNGKYVNMGDFRDISYNHNKSQTIVIEVQFEDKQKKSEIKILSSWVEDKSNKLPFLDGLNVETNYYKYKIDSIEENKYLVNLKHDLDKDPMKHLYSRDSFLKFLEGINTILGIKPKITERKHKKKQTDEGLFSEDELTVILAPKNDIEIKIEKSSFFKKFLDAQTNFQFTLVQNDFSNKLTSIEKKINYISSFRLNPDRTLLEQSRSEFKVGGRGEGYLDQIIYWETYEKEKFLNLVKQLKDLKLLNTIKSNRLEGGRYEIRIKPNSKGVFSSLTDVGFGISQFLPLIVADTQLPDNSTLFVSQPEIHLHPSIQSKFGEYVANQVKSSDKNYVLETHSEYLINRLRLAIVEGYIAEEDVKLYHLENKNNEAIVHPVKLTKTGEIIGAPQDFFDTYMIDTMNIAMAAMAD